MGTPANVENSTVIPGLTVSEARVPPPPATRRPLPVATIVPTFCALRWASGTTTPPTTSFAGRRRTISLSYNGVHSTVAPFVGRLPCESSHEGREPGVLAPRCLGERRGWRRDHLLARPRAREPLDRLRLDRLRPSRDRLCLRGHGLRVGVGPDRLRLGRDPLGVGRPRHRLGRLGTRRLSAALRLAVGRVEPPARAARAARRGCGCA